MDAKINYCHDEETTEELRNEVDNIFSYGIDQNAKVFSAAIVDLVNAAHKKIMELNTESIFDSKIIELIKDDIETLLKSISEVFKNNYSHELTIYKEVFDTLFFSNYNLLNKIPNGGMFLIVKRNNNNLDKKKNFNRKFQERDAPLVTIIHALILKLRRAKLLMRRRNVISENIMRLTGDLDKIIDSIPAPQEKQVEVDKQFEEEDNTEEKRETIIEIYEPLVLKINLAFKEAVKSQRIAINKKNDELVSKREANVKREKSEGWQKVNRNFKK